MLKASKSFFLVASISLNVLLIAFFVGKRIYYSRDWNKKPETVSFADIYNKTRTDVFNTLSIDSNSIVFVGNSITEGLPVELFNNPNVKK